MNVGKYGLAVLIRIASSPFGVFKENDWCAPTGFRICEYWKLENGDDCLYSISELLENYNDYIHDIRTTKKKF